MFQMLSSMPAVHITDSQFKCIDAKGRCFRPSKLCFVCGRAWEPLDYSLFDNNET